MGLVPLGNYGGTVDNRGALALQLKMYSVDAKTIYLVNMIQITA